MQKTGKVPSLANLKEDRVARLPRETQELINRIILMENALIVAQKDNMHVPKRLHNSRTHHLGTEFFSEAPYDKLVDYFYHVKRKIIGGLL